METQTYFEDRSAESMAIAPDKPEESVEKTIQNYLRQGIKNSRVDVGQTLGNVFESLKWPSHEEWLALEKAQRQESGKN
jgi:hypothetical protein